MVEQTPTSVEQTKFSLLYIVEQNQTMAVEQNHTMPVEQANVTPPHMRRDGAGKSILPFKQNSKLYQLYNFYLLSFDNVHPFPSQIVEQNFAPLQSILITDPSKVWVTLVAVNAFTGFTCTVLQCID